MKLALLFLSFVSLSASAQIVKPLQFTQFTDFCSNPIRAICKPFFSAALDRKTRRDVLAQKIYNLAESRTIQKLNLPYNFKMSELKIKGTAWDKLRIPPIFIAAFNEELKAEIGQVEFKALGDKVENIRSTLQAAIRKDFELKFEVSMTLLRDKMIQEIGNIIILDSEKIYDAFATPPSHRTELIKDYERTCGLDGMADNAFARQVENSKYLIVCPGLLMTAAGGGNDIFSNTVNMLQVLGHEMGHHIDFAFKTEFYNNYLTCLGNHYSNELLDPLLNPEIGTNYQKLAAPENTMVRKMISHGREITADYWGTKTVAQYLYQIAKISNFTMNLEVLKQSHEYLCGTGDEGIHPTGDYRIGHLLRYDSDISQIMGCAPQSHCTL